MRADDLVVEVRDRTLTRVSQIDTESLVLHATLPANGVGKWELSLPSEHPATQDLREPGAGIVVTHSPSGVAGTVLWSGPVNVPTTDTSSSDPEGVVTVTGVTDDVILWNRLAYPSPSLPATSQTASHDVRSGPAESVMLGYVEANIGPSAPTPRRIPGLVVTPSLGRGGVVDYRARFEVLGEVLTSIATRSGLLFRLVQAGSELVVEVTEANDLSASIRLDVHNGTIESASATSQPPSLTRALVLGQGEGADRTVIERTTAAAVAAELAYGPWARVERTLDQRQTDVTVELEQAGDEALAAGAGGTAASAVVAADQEMAWPRDWDRGDQIAIVIDGVETLARVTSIEVSAGPGGVVVGAGIGDPQGYSPFASLGRRQDATDARVSALERNAETTPGGGIVAWAEVTGKPLAFPPEAHSHPWGGVTGKPTEFPPSLHVHAAGDTTSGVFAAARLPAATVSAQGAVVRATSALALAGTETTRYMTPALVREVLGVTTEWQNVPLRSGFVHVGTNPLQVRRFLGALQVQGGITNAGLAASATRAIGDLPAGFRPASLTPRAPAVSASAAQSAGAHFRLYPDGGIELLLPASLGAYYIVAGITQID